MKNRENKIENINYNKNENLEKEKKFKMNEESLKLEYVKSKCGLIYEYVYKYAIEWVNERLLSTEYEWMGEWML